MVCLSESVLIYRMPDRFVVATIEEWVQQAINTLDEGTIRRGSMFGHFLLQIIRSRQRIHLFGLGTSGHDRFNQRQMGTLRKCDLASTFCGINAIL
jgi:hypothetical protein